MRKNPQDIARLTESHRKERDEFAEPVGANCNISFPRKERWKH